MNLFLDPVTILQDARAKLLYDSGEWDANAYWVLCAAIRHLIDGSRISTVDRVPFSAAPKGE